MTTETAIRTSLTPAQLDELIAHYEHQVQLAAEADQRVEAVATQLIAHVREHGTKPETAAQSWRLEGVHNSATVTIGTTRTLRDDAIGKLREYMASQSVIYLFKKLFEESTKYTLIGGARDVLTGVDLPKRTREKILGLFGMCLDVKDKKPSLSVKAIKPQKPAKQPRAGKKVA